MSGRQRLLDTLNGQKTDRVPCAPFLFTNVAREYFGQDADITQSVLNLCRRWGFDALLRHVIIGEYVDEAAISCDTWRVETSTQGVPGSSWAEYTTIHTPRRQLRQVKAFRRVTPNEVVEAVVESYIKDADDFDQFRRYQPPPRQCDCAELIRAGELVGGDGLSGTWVHGAFTVAGTYRKLGDLLMDPYVDDVFYAELIEHFLARLIDFCGQALAAGADALTMGGNMATGSLAGPVYFEKYVKPYEMRLIDAIHGLGGKVIYHNCGDARALLPAYADMNIDMLETLTAPPYGDVDLREALNVLPVTTVLSGNIDQIAFLKEATPAQVRENVRQVLTEAKRRGAFILAASDYISEGTPEENMRAFADAAREFGAY